MRSNKKVPPYLKKAEQLRQEGWAIWTEKKDARMAVAKLTEASALVPQDHHIRLGIAEIYFQSGQHKRALRQYELCLRQDATLPNDAESVYYGLCDEFKEQKDLNRPFAAW